MTDLEKELFAALKEVVDAKQEEDTYRWDNIGSYPMVKIPTKVREKWLDDLHVILNRQHKALDNAKEVIKRLS